MMTGLHGQMSFHVRRAVKYEWSDENGSAKAFDVGSSELDSTGNHRNHHIPGARKTRRARRTTAPVARSQMDCRSLGCLPRHLVSSLVSPATANYDDRTRAMLRQDLPCSNQGRSSAEPSYPRPEQADQSLNPDKQQGTQNQQYQPDASLPCGWTGPPLAGIHWPERSTPDGYRARRKFGDKRTDIPSSRRCHQLRTGVHAWSQTARDSRDR